MDPGFRRDDNIWVLFYFVAAMIESRRIVGKRLRISSGVDSGGDIHIVSPTAGSALPGRARTNRPRAIASRPTLTPSPNPGALGPLSVPSPLPHIMPSPRMSPTSRQSLTYAPRPPRSYLP